MRYLNQMWVVYTAGVAAAIFRKRSHSATPRPQGTYGAEFAELSIMRRFSKNGGAIKACSTETEGATDF